MNTQSLLQAALNSIESAQADIQTVVDLSNVTAPVNPMRVGEYVPPVTGDPSEWYFASTHKPPSHYGLDINLRISPRGDVELGYPVLATCAGLVAFAGRARGTSWGNLIVTMSLDDTGPIYWRYGHCKDLMVKRGEFVRSGQQIGTIGKGYNNRYYAHLHLDAARGLQGPGEWGNKDIEWLDPLRVWAIAKHVWNWGEA